MLKKINKGAETKGLLSERYFDLLLDIQKNNVQDYRKSKAVSPIFFHNTLGLLTPKFRELDANNSKDLLLFLFQSMHDELNYYGDQKLSLIGTYNQSIPQDALNLFLNTNYSLNLSIFSHLFFGICESKIKCEKCATIF